MLDEESEALLAEVHPDLARVIRRAGQGARFRVVQGLRDRAEEAKAVAAGRSSTMHSRHLPGKTGEACAVDLAVLGANGQVDWAPGHEAEVYGALAQEVFAAAAAEGIAIQWGGDWAKPDWDHFQLPWADYP